MADSNAPVAGIVLRLLRESKQAPQSGSLPRNASPFISAPSPSISVDGNTIGGETVWMNVDLKLNDGSGCFGALSFHIYRKHVIYLTFVRSDNHRLSLRINEQDKDPKELVKVANFLGKSVEQVFPVRYTTPYIYLDGTLIEGVY